jgi:hypothetical protein
MVCLAVQWAVSYGLSGCTMGRIIWSLQPVWLYNGPYHMVSTACLAVQWAVSYGLYSLSGCTMGRIIWSLQPVWLYNVFPHYLICGTNFGKKLLKIKCVLFYVFFWVIPRRLNFVCRRFGALCRYSSYLSAYEDGTDGVFRNVGI